MAAVAPVPFTVINAMTACGLDLASATTFATQIFMENFETCKDIYDNNIDDALKTLSILTVVQGQIHLMPASKEKIKAFIQWVKDQFRLGVGPTVLALPVNSAAELLRRVKTHNMLIACSDAITSAAKPDKLTKDTKWEDWTPSFLKYLRAIPGRYGVPFKYIVRDNELPDATLNVDFLDNYITNAPLTGQEFTIDAAEVHSYIVSFITKNNKAE